MFCRHDQVDEIFLCPRFLAKISLIYDEMSDTMCI